MLTVVTVVTDTNNNNNNNNNNPSYCAIGYNASFPCSSTNQVCQTEGRPNEWTWLALYCTVGW